MLKKYVIGPLETNCYLYTDDITGHSAVIDPAYPDKRLLSDLKNERVDYIFITHAHIDHIYGAAAVKELTGARVVAHPHENKRLHDTDENLYDTFHSLYQNQGIYKDPYVAVDIDETVDTGSVITLGKTMFSVLHTPGHTNGSVSFITDRDIFCGDTIFEGSYGRVDFPSGSFADLTDSFRRLCFLDGDYMIYPGHQGSTTLRNERNFNPLKTYLYN